MTRKLFIIILSLTLTLLLPSAFAFPGWNNINTIYYNSSQDDVTNKFLLQAANELKTNLENVSLKTFTIINTTAATPPAIFLINDSSHPQLTGKNEESFWLYTNSSGVYIIGKTPIAVRHGAYTLLEKLGYRYFFKHPMWKVKPASLISLDGLDEIQEPDFIWRRIWHAVSVDGNIFSGWKNWNRLEGAAIYDVEHDFGFIPDSEFNTNPDLFCPVGGPPRQLNVDNPEVLSRAIDYEKNALNQTTPRRVWDSNNYLFDASVSVSPRDGLGWCWDESNPQLITDKVFNFTNQVAKAVQADFPDKYVGVYSYSLYSCTPSFDLEDNILVQVATSYNRCGQSLKVRLADLLAKGVLLGIRDYYDVNVWYRDYPPSNFYNLLESIPWYVNNGVKVYNAESGDGWGARGLLYYVASKLYWEPNANITAILEDFYTKSFGPAKDVMKRFYERWFSGQTVSDRTLALAFRDLNEAEQLATGNEEVLERIRHLEYWVRHVWLWYRGGVEDYGSVTQPGKLSLEESRNYYTFITKIRNLYAIFYRYIESNLRENLQLWGLSSSEINALADYTPPTPAQARAWLDEALAYYASLDAVDVQKIDPYKLSLVPLGRTDLPSFSSSFQTRRLQIIVDSVGNENIDVRLKGTGSITWIGPDRFQISSISVNSQDFSTFQFPAQSPGFYTLQIDRGGFINGIEIPGRGAAILANEQSVPWVLGSITEYFQVPANTSAFVLGGTGTTERPVTIKLTKPDNSTSSFVFTKDEEIAVKSPQSGIWRLDAQAISGALSINFWLTGIPPLIWYDPQYLLVPANTVLKLILGQYRQAMKPIVDGSNITIEIPIIFYDKSSTAFTVSKPLWNNTINFRFNESGTVSSINTTYITFTVDPNKNVALLFDIPPPRKTRDTVAIQNQTFYRKEITISSNNSLTNVTATIDINTTYTSYKLYELQGSTWIDVTSNYNLTISNNTATFSGFSTSEKQFRIEGIQPIQETPPEQPSQPPAQPQPSPAAGGPVTSISTPITSPITKEPETIKPTEVKQETGAVSLELTAPDTVESGDIYDATVKLLSPIKKTYTLTISNIKQNVDLEAGKEKLLTIPIRAMEARGSFSLIASIDGTTKSKIINLDYKPLFLYVNESKAGNETLITVTVKNYQPLSTELRIIKDGRSDVFIELIEGQKEYQRQLKLTQPGEYKIIATASSQGKTIDTDSYMLTISGKPTFDYRLFLIITFAFVVIVMTLTFLIK